MHPLIPSGAAALALLAFALDPTPLAAQTSQGIIGVTQTLPVVVSQDFPTCTPAQCTPLGFPPQATPFSGGAAWDPITRGLWISDGLLIAKVDPRNGCAYQCPPMPMPNTGPGSEVTGLAFDEFTKTLWVTDAAGLIRWYAVSGCNLTLISRCLVPFSAAGEVLTGIASDDVNALLYYCTALPGAPGGILYVAKQSAPCVPLCKLQVTRCGGNPLGPLMGAAYDACRDTPWVTDGRRSVRIAVNLAACSLNEVQCCVNPVDAYIGLCVMPSTEANVGNPCTRPICPPCPTMRHVLNGDPVLGNPAFSWDLINAPANALTVLVLNVGACSPPGVPVPWLCGPILVPLAPPPFISPVIATGGIAGCTGGASLPYAFPPNPAFCGLPVATQWIGICPGAAAFGSFVSNCISLVVTAT